MLVRGAARGQPVLKLSADMNPVADPPTSHGAAAPMVGDAGEGRGGEGPG